MVTSSDYGTVKAAFRAMGPDAVPFLVRRMETAPSWRIERALSVITVRSGLAYRQKREMWQQEAAYLLGELGPAARSAELNLVKAAGGPRWGLGGAATVALMKIRQQPLQPLIEKLKDTNDGTAWYENAMMVGQFGSRAEPAIPILLDALQHTNNIIQGHALLALGMIARQPNECIPAIVPFLSSPIVSDRQKALGALLGFGTNAIVARKAIQSALTDSDPWVRMEAARAIKILDGMPGTKVGENHPEPGTRAKPSQPMRSETNRTPSGAGTGP